MGGRFGKYGDLKRRRVLQRSRREKNRLTRRGNPPQGCRKRRDGRGASDINPR